MSLQVVGQSPSQVSPSLSCPSPQAPLQSVSVVATQPLAQHPSPLTQAVISLCTQRAVHSDALPTSVEVVHARFPAHATGQFPSQNSPSSTTPSPQTDCGRAIGAQAAMPTRAATHNGLKWSWARRDGIRSPYALVAVFRASGAGPDAVNSRRRAGQSTALSGRDRTRWRCERNVRYFNASMGAAPVGADGGLFAASGFFRKMTKRNSKSWPKVKTRKSATMVASRKGT